MATKKKVVEVLDRPGDLFVTGHRRQWAWMKRNIDEAAWLLHTKLNAVELREIADWSRKAADFIDQQKAAKIK